MKQHEAPESTVAGAPHQEPSTVPTSDADRVTLALEALAEECRLLLSPHHNLRAGTTPRRQRDHEQ